MDCTSIIISGIEKDCSTVNGSTGVDKDLILVNYEDFDKIKTLDPLNRETTGSNVQGLKSIFLRKSTVQHIFEGTDYSVIPSIIPEEREIGGTWYGHQILFTVYSKLATDRKTLQDLGGSKVIAIAKDRSTGLYELFGMDQGLKVSALTRAYIGAQNSNFYQVTIATPELGIVKESGLGELSKLITTNV